MPQEERKKRKKKEKERKVYILFFFLFSFSFSFSFLFSSPPVRPSPSPRSQRSNRHPFLFFFRSQQPSAAASPLLKLSAATSISFFISVREAVLQQPPRNRSSSPFAKQPCSSRRVTVRSRSAAPLLFRRCPAVSAGSVSVEATVLQPSPPVLSS